MGPLPGDAPTEPLVDHVAFVNGIVDQGSMLLGGLLSEFDRNGEPVDPTDAVGPNQAYRALIVLEADTEEQLTKLTDFGICPRAQRCRLGVVVCLDASEPRKFGTYSACRRAKRKRLDLMDAQVLGVGAKERADRGDLVPEGQVRRKGWKHLHGVQVEVCDEKEMHVLQRALSIVLLPDMEQRALHTNASVDERAIRPRRPGQADAPQCGGGSRRVRSGCAHALERPA